MSAAKVFQYLCLSRLAGVVHGSSSCLIRQIDPCACPDQHPTDLTKALGDGAMQGGDAVKISQIHPNRRLLEKQRDGLMPLLLDPKNRSCAFREPHPSLPFRAKKRRV